MLIRYIQVCSLVVSFYLAYWRFNFWYFTLKGIKFLFDAAQRRMLCADKELNELFEEIEELV